MPVAKGTTIDPARTRAAILEAATPLLYERGLDGVGVAELCGRLGVSKETLYRHFGTKDDLVVAFLQRMDQEFWQTWDTVTAQHADDARAELHAQLDWIGERAGQPDYRGCPQLNIAAEYPEVEHPARQLATAHKRELRRRLKVIAERLHCAAPDALAGQLAVLINGAFVSTPLYEPGEATRLLQRAADALIAAHVAA